MKTNRIVQIVVALFVCFSTGCNAQAAGDGSKEKTKNIGKLSGIPILTFTDGNPWKTDMGSNFGLLLGPEERFSECRDKPTVSQRLLLENGNPYLSLRFNNLQIPHIFAGAWISVFGNIDVKDVAMPAEIAAKIDGLTFRLRAPGDAVRVKVEVKDAGREIISQEYFKVGKSWDAKSMRLHKTDGMKEIVFVIESRFQPGFNGAPSGTLDIDDVCLTTSDSTKVPIEGNELLSFAKDRCIRYFVWNYREAKGGTGFVLERNSFHDLVSISGMGFAFPAVVMAEKDGIISAAQSRSQTLAMLKWIEKIDCRKGGGLNGFPFHFLTPDGKRAGTSEVSTVDWAICAAGIRVAMQHFSGDREIAEIGRKLLGRPDWNSVLSKNGLISHGFSVNSDGTSSLIATDWGSSFTEESYLVALEAVASGKIGSGIFSDLKKEAKGGFWPSFFGSSFTYNWLQLWTGPREPFASNSRKAFDRDASFCMKRYGRPLLGSTACETFSGSDESGFLKWDAYTGETGSDVFLAEEGAVKHLSVCPYGAALALPFAREKAMAALAEFAKLSGVHPVIGLPDSIRLEELPKGFKNPIPSWTQFAIDIGPMWMAIEASEGNRVSGLYLKDASVRQALEQLDEAMKAK